MKRLTSTTPNNDPALMCKCGKNPAELDHPCPYQQEINDDGRDVCVCCADCQHECAMDV